MCPRLILCDEVLMTDPTVYILSGQVILNMSRTFLMTVLTAMHRLRRACIRLSSSTLTRQAL